MKNTKIDWCDSTFNPVTGCLHGCEYCYARGIATRFGFHASEPDINERVLHECPISGGKKVPYPFDFQPTFHKYRLNDYIGKQGRNIFVCSMADLFGDWVPDSWIEDVFDACDRASQHNYLFLSKNPKRYEQAIKDNYKDFVTDHMSNFWFGTTVTNDRDLIHKGGDLFASIVMNCEKKEKFNHFLSMEPLLEKIVQLQCLKHHDWVIIGAETGRRKDKVVPERKWIEDIVNECRKLNIPVFMKSSLVDIWGEPLIQEFPEVLRK